MNDEEKLYFLVSQAEDIQKYSIDLSKKAKDNLENLQNESEKIVLSIKEVSKVAKNEIKYTSELIDNIGKRYAIYFFSAVLFFSLSICSAVFFGAKYLANNELEKYYDLQDRNKILSDNISFLEKKGGKIKFTQCGEDKRLCILIDKKAQVYGESSERWIIPEGY